MLQNYAHFSFPITLSILIFLIAMNKEKLEKTTGLRILQTGVGEVSGLEAFYTLKNILIVIFLLVCFGRGVLLLLLLFGFNEILELMSVRELPVW